MDAHSVNTIICPMCEATLSPSDEVCANCGASTRSDSAKTKDQRESHITRLKKDGGLNRPWVLIIVLLHIGLLGIPLYWKLKYPAVVRILIILTSIAYTLFAVVAIYWLVLWIAESFRSVFG